MGPSEVSVGALATAAMKQERRRRHGDENRVSGSGKWGSPLRPISIGAGLTKSSEASGAGAEGCGAEGVPQVPDPEARFSSPGLAFSFSFLGVCMNHEFDHK